MGEFKKGSRVSGQVSGGGRRWGDIVKVHDDGTYTVSWYPNHDHSSHTGEELEDASKDTFRAPGERSSRCQTRRITTCGYGSVTKTRESKDEGVWWCNKRRMSFILKEDTWEEVGGDPSKEVNTCPCYYFARSPQD